MSSSSSPESAAVRSWRPAERPDLRTGVWTRLGDPSVLGDDVTEQALGRLAQRTRDAARAQGYAVGWAEGRTEALARAEEAAALVAAQAAEREREREAEHRRALDALRAAATELRGTVADTCDRIAAQATDLAFELTRELVGHELTVQEDPGAGVVRRVLAALPTAPLVTVRVHPSVAEAPAAHALAEQGVSLQPDAALAPGGAIVEVDDAAIDLRVESALDRLRQALR
ncbi:FliH/SctL family protein [Nocardioides aquiterrae]|uniref:Flagellar assembly protein FliH/Type III secretion system HrpE domain-containing protein n=1 Tax=Nocardioides aquiterrae TaxID=203799 RepID=A0ABP4EVV2_9ACTN